MSVIRAFPARQMIFDIRNISQKPQPGSRRTIQRYICPPVNDIQYSKHFRRPQPRSRRTIPRYIWICHKRRSGPRVQTKRSLFRYPKHSKSGNHVEQQLHIEIFDFCRKQTPRYLREHPPQQNQDRQPLLWSYLGVKYLYMPFRHQILKCRSLKLSYKVSLSPNNSQGYERGETSVSQQQSRLRRRWNLQDRQPLLWSYLGVKYLYMPFRHQILKCRSLKLSYKVSLSPNNSQGYERGETYENDLFNEAFFPSSRWRVPPTLVTYASD